MKKLYPKQLVKKYLLVLVACFALQQGFAQGNAVSFNGTNQYGTVTLSNLNGNAIAYEYTVEAWVKPNSTSGAMEIFSTRGATDLSFDMKLQNGNTVHADIGDGATKWYTTSADATLNYKAGTWYHIAYTVSLSQNSYKVYINGNLAASGTIGSPIPTLPLFDANHPTGYIGSNAGTSEFFNGGIDEVRVYQAALNQAQVQADMASTTLNGVSPQLYFNFNQSATSFSDVSGSTRTGTEALFNTPTWPESYAMVIPASISAAGNITATSFTANWGTAAMGTVNNYVIDVATDANFTNLVSASSPKTVSSATTSTTVSGLTAGTIYYYRVRADKTSVTGQGANVTSAAFITAGKPAISSFSPVSGAAGSSVTITGTGFSTTPANNIVYFGGGKATVTAATATTITATIPTGATYGPVTVTTNGLTSYSSKQFILTFNTNNAVINSNSFTAPATTDVLAGATKITNVDFDGDGLTDILLNYGTNKKFSILRNKSTAGNVAYDTRIDFSLDSYSGMSGFATVAVADFDGDGKLDIVVEDASRYVILKNTSTSGSISFSAGTPVSAGLSNIMDIAAADINGDGKPDLVLNYAGSVIVCMNTSNASGITFDAGTTTANTTTASSSSEPTLALADMNGDGLTDVVTLSPNGAAISVLKNTSTLTGISFAGAVTFTTASQPFALHLGDFDGDGNLDIACGFTTNNSSSRNTISMFRNTGSGGAISFDAAQNFSVPANISGGSNSINNFATGDIDGDGKVDLFVIDREALPARIWINSSAGGNTFSFSTPAAYSGTGTGNIAFIGDVDGDGFADMGMQGFNSSSQVAVLRNVIGIPFISSFTGSNATDSTLTITGSNFTGATAVTIGGVAAKSFSVVSNTSITAVVGANATSTSVAVTGPKGTASVTGFVYIPAPTISAVSPTTLGPGVAVTITGTNFANIKSITFGGVVVASYTINSSTQITATVGAGAAGNLVITATGGIVTYSNFTYSGPITAAVITSISPLAAPAGATITISGSGFGATTAENIVYFGTVKAVVTAASTTSLSVTVPAGIAYQPVSVTVNSATTYFSKPFIATFSGAETTLKATSFNGAYNTGIAAGSYAAYTAFGDFNNDGKPDMVNGNSTSQLSVYQNNSVKGATVSFASAAGFTTTQSIKPVIADFDGDGKLDIAEMGATSFAVLRNTSSGGTISFSQGGQNSTTQVISMGTAADIDGDGRPDLVVRNGSNMSIYLNTTSGNTISFAAAVYFTLGSSPSGDSRMITTADADGDGKVDVITLDGNNVVVLKNTSSAFSASLASGVTYATLSNPTNISAADITGDGRPEIFVSYANSSNYSIYQNTGTGSGVSFAAKKDISSTAGTLRNVNAGDINGDGLVDLVEYGLANSGTIAVSLNTTNGTDITFTSTSYGLLTDGGFELRDIDGDGRVDLCLRNNSDNFLVVRNRIASATVTSFTPAAAPKDGAVSISGYNMAAANQVVFGGTPAKNFTVVDGSTITATVNAGTSGLIGIASSFGDTSFSATNFTYIDVPTLTSFTPTTASATKTVVITGTNFSFASGVTFGGIPALSFTVNDNTSITAVVADGSASGNVAVITQAGTATKAGFTFAPIPVITSFSPALGPVGTAVTITGSNFKSTAAGNIVYVGGVKATVSTASASSLTITIPAGANYQPISVTTSDSLTAYSKQPFVVTFANATAFGTKSFTPMSTFPVESAAYNVAAGDLDGDGLNDVAVSYANSSVLSVSVYRNNGSAGNVSFDNRQNLVTSTGTSLMFFTDMDGDGKLDVVVMNNNKNISIFKNTSTQGSISFAARLDFSTISGSMMTIADIDLDGRPDVVVGSNQKLTIYRNTTATGVISFSSGTSITTTSPSPTAIKVGDIDQDGKPDLVVSCNLPDKLGVFKNNSTPGNISLATQVDLTARSNADNIAIGDLNNDGLPDILVGYQFATLQPVSVFVNTTNGGNISFAAKQDIASGGDSPFPSIADMNGDGLPDIAASIQFANGASKDFTILKNNTSASLSFQTAVIFGTDGKNESGIVTDIDGDGKPDMVIANYNPNNFKVFRNRINEPAIASFSPTSAGTGATITITGTNLQDVTGITFGGKAARSFTIVNSTTVTAVVDTLSNSNAYVKAGYAISADSVSGFSYTAAPVITSFTPTTIGPSSLVTITGTGFSGTTSVTFGGVPAVSFTANATTITAIVANALAGNVVVKAPGGTGSLSGFVITAQTPPGNMLEFETGSVNIPTGNVTVEGSYTVEAWVMSIGTSGQGESIFSTRAGGANNTFDMKIGDNGTLQADIGDGTNWLTTSANSSFTIARNRWYHIAYAVTPQGYTIYANGNPVDSGTFSGNPVLINSSHSGITLGFLNPSNTQEYFLGGIDEVKVWSTARTKAQVNSDMLSPVSSPRAETTLVAYYNFDEGVAGANNNVDAASYRYLADLSANNLTGQLVSFSLTNATRQNWLESYAMVIPTQPQATAITATGFTANWIAPQVGTIDQYILEVATNASFSTIVQTLNPASGSTSANITSLASGTQYWFRLKADKASVTGKSAYSNVVAVKTLTVPTISSFTPLGTTQSGTVTITGTNFSDVTAVTFGGTAAAAFTIVNATTITATVGAGTTGSVVVTAPGGTATKTGFIYIVPVTPPGNALNYSNGSEYVSIGTGSTVVSQNFTVEAWVRPQDVSKTMNILSTNIAGANAFDMKLQGGTTITGDIGNGFNIVTSSTPTATFNYTAGKWCHIAFVVTTRNWFIYGNGVLLGSGGYVANPLFIGSTRNIINIGHQTGSDNLVGSIDEVKVWNVARTQADIQADMANVISSPASTSNLVLYLTFDQGTAGGNNSLVGSLFDQSANHFTGTLNGFGLTGSSSNWVESYATVIPAATPATNVTNNSFIANWTAPAAGTVDNYILEVANNAGFSPILNTYTPAITSQVVSGLTPGANYWYRVRAEKASVTGQGYNSAVIPVTTAGIPVINSFTPQAFHGGQVTISGQNFTNASAVSFGGTPAITYTVDNASTITAYVEFGTSGIVSVTTPGGTATAPGFTYLEQTASATGDASVCRNGASANITFSASNGITPFTFTYKVNGGAPQTVTTTSGNSVNLSVTPAAAPAASITYTLVSVDDNAGYHTNVNSDVVIAIKDPTSSTTPVAICSTNLPYSWNGGTYNTAGTYTAHLNNAAGCDSVATLVLTVKQATTSTTLATICSTDPAYVWNGASYSTAGSYTAHLTNAAGCDSAATLILTVNQASSSSTPVTICSSQLPYVWNGSSYNAAGSYDVHLTNAAGCDSTATLVLTVNAVTTSRTDITRCANDAPYHWGVSGQDYTNAGTYTFTSINAAGCDNIDSLVITVNQPTSSVTYATTCANVPYHWGIDGQDYTAEGTYTYTTTNAAGCDNIDSLVLTFIQPTGSTVNVTVCTGQLPYNWNGQDYNNAGTYTYVTTNAAGCDSTVTLNFNVVPYFQTEESQSLCTSQLQGYMWNGNDLTGATSGDYYYATTAASGCDSFVILHLTVTPSATSTTTVKICQAQLPYSWNGNNYNTSGIYTVNLTNAAGCDSIATLILTAHTDTTYAPVYIDASALPYTWNGHAFSSGGTYPVTLTSDTGCDSLAVLILNINGQPAPQSFVYNTPNKLIKDRTITPLLPTTLEGAKTDFGPVIASPAGIASDAVGNAYIVSGGADYVLKIYADGTGTKNIGSGITSATGVAVDLRGNIYVTQNFGTPLTKISPDGIVTNIAVTGIYYATGVATDQQGNIFVADIYSGVYKIAPDGTQTMFFPDGDYPSFVSTDYAGNVYVTDGATGNITKVTADGSTTTPVGPAIGSPGNVVADALDNIYTVSSNNGLIQKIAPDGTAIPVSFGYIQPMAIAPATPGYIYVLNFTGQINKMSIEGGTPSSYTISPALPAGLILDAATGAITGKPNVLSPLTTYTVSASNTGGSTTAAVDIRVADAVAPPTALPGAFSYTTPNVLVKGTVMANLSPAFVAPGTIKKVASPTVYAPLGTAVDAAGNVYVADAAYGSVFKIAPDGTYITMGNGLLYPLGIAVSTTGEVYVADAGDGVIKKISADGSTVTPVTGGYATPVDVSVDAAGNIYVADNSPFVTEIAADGTSSTFWTDNNYNGISSVSVDMNDNVYVGNYAGIITKIISGTGTVVGTIPSFTSGITTDAAGNVYALNTTTPGNCIVYKIEPDGTVSTVVSGLDNYFGIASDASGNLYTTNVVNGISEIDKIFGESGPVSSYAITPALPQGLTFNASTGVISGTPLQANPQITYTVTATNANGSSSAQLVITVTDKAGQTFGYNTPNVYVKNAAIQPLTPIYAPKLPVKTGTITTLPGTFSNPTGLAFDANGNLYVSNTDNYEVDRINKDGTVDLVTYSGLVGPQGMAIDAAGYIYVVNGYTKNSPLIKMDVNGNVSTIGRKLNYPGGVALDAAGNIYIAEWGAKQVIKMTPDGNTVTVLASSFVFNGPNGIAVDAAGNVFVADYDGKKVVKIDINDVATVLAPSHNFGGPADVKLDAKGNVYVADQPNNEVDKIAPDGTVTQVGSGFDAPGGLTLDAAGNIYVSDSDNGVVKKVTGNADDYSNFTITPALPDGLVLDTATGIISGTPVVISPTKKYTIIVHKADSVITANTVITVNADANAKITICASDTALLPYYWNGQYYNTSGNYTATLKDVAGNDSILTLQLTISGPAATLSAAGNKDSVCYSGQRTITAKPTGAVSAYQYSLDGTNYQAGNSFLVKPGTYEVKVVDVNGCYATTNAVTIIQPAAKLKAASLLVNGSSVTVTASGGFGNYMYSVNSGTFQPSNTFTAAVNDIITIKDAAGCTTTANVQLPSATLAAAGNKDTICYNAQRTIAVTATGGALPYQYSFDGGAYQAGNTLLAKAGTHTATVKDATGYTFTTNSTTIIQPAEKLKVASTQINGSSVTVIASGGYGSYMYSINGGTLQSSNTFTAAINDVVTVKDLAGCLATGNVKLPVATLAAAGNKDTICYNAQRTLAVTATGGVLPYQYSLDGGAYQPGNTFLVKAGTHTATVKDAGGYTLTTNSVTIIQPAAKLDVATSQVNVSCNGSSDGKITLTASGGFAGYTYSINNGSFGSSNLFTGLAADTYTLYVKDKTGCSITKNVIITQPATPCASFSATPAPPSFAKANETGELKIKVYPNPAIADFNLEIVSGDIKNVVELRVMDMLGKTVYHTRGSVYDMFRFGRTFAGGIYIAEVLNGNNVQRIKLVKGN